MADLKIQQLDPIIGSLQDNDKFLVKMKVRGTAVTDEDRSVTWLEMRNALNLTQYMPTVGGTFTGNVSLSNGSSLQGKTFNGAGNINIVKTNSDNSLSLGDFQYKVTLQAVTVPQYNDGANTYDIITAKNLPAPGSLSAGGAYNKTEANNLLSAKFDKSGGTFTGNVILDKNISISVTDSQNAIRQILQLNSSGLLNIGATNTPVSINSSQIPVWNNGNASIKFITESNLPSTSALNTYSKTEIDTKLNDKVNIINGTLTGTTTVDKLVINGETSWKNNGFQVNSGVSVDGNYLNFTNYGTNPSSAVGNVLLPLASGTVYTTANKPTIGELGLADTVSKASTALQPGAGGINGSAIGMPDAAFFLDSNKGKIFYQDGTSAAQNFGGEGIGFHGYYSLNTTQNAMADLFVKSDGKVVAKYSVNTKGTGANVSVLTNTLYGTLNKPTAADVDAYSKSESDSKFATAGVNNNITNLTGLTTTIKLGADATQPTEATTLRQVQAMTSGTAGAVVGVVGGFIGAVMWFNGTDRSKVPAGWLPADGQEVFKTDWPDLWDAVNKKSLISTTQANWTANRNARAMYAYDTSSTSFRLPDLNGQQSGSITGVFLRGHSAAAEAVSGAIGEMRVNAAPNITGMVSSVAGDLTIGTFYDAAGAFKVGALKENRIVNPQTDGNAASTVATFDASLSNAAYGRDGTAEVRPNSAVGIWIIRATNQFEAANSSFRVYNGVSATPANGAQTYGGSLTSMFSVGGVPKTSASLLSSYKWGNPTAYSVIQAKNEANGKIANYHFGDNGAIIIPNGGSLNTSPLDEQTTDGQININANLSTRNIYAGQLIRTTGGENNNIGVQSFGGGVAAGFFVNLITYSWYNSAVRTGLVRGTGSDIGDYRIQVAQGADAGGQTGDFAFKSNGQISTPLGTVATTGSDRILKDNETVARDGARERIMKIVAKEFDWKSTGIHDRGYIAQDLLDIDKTYVQESKMFVDGKEKVTLTVSNNAIIADLITTVQGLCAEIEQLKAGNGSSE